MILFSYEYSNKIVLIYHLFYKALYINYLQSAQPPVQYKIPEGRRFRPFNRKKFLSNPHGEPWIHAFSRGRQPEIQPSTYRQRIKQSAVAEQAVRHAHNRPKKHKKDALMGRRSATHKYAFIDIDTIGRAPSYYGYSQEIYTR